MDGIVVNLTDKIRTLRATRVIENKDMEDKKFFAKKR